MRLLKSRFFCPQEATGTKPRSIWCEKQEKSSIPNTERGFNWEAQESTGIPCEDVTDVSPLVGIQEVNVRGVLDALPQVHQAAHQDLDIWERPATAQFVQQTKDSVSSCSFHMENRQKQRINSIHPHLHKKAITAKTARRAPLLLLFRLGSLPRCAAWKFASSRLTFFVSFLTHTVA